MAGHFEAKKHAYRQTQDGIVVSFVIHPNDVDAKFATASLGTRYMIGFAEIGDDDAPAAEPSPQAAGGHARAAALTPEVRSEIATKAANTRWDATKERKPFVSLPLSQQAAIRTGDKDFQAFLETETPIHDQESYADAVRAICGVESRADIKPGTPAAIAWMTLDARYQSWRTTRQYAESAR